MSNPYLLQCPECERQFDIRLSSTGYPTTIADGKTQMSCPECEFDRWVLAGAPQPKYIMLRFGVIDGVDRSMAKINPLYRENLADTSKIENFLTRLNKLT